MANESICDLLNGLSDTNKEMVETIVAALSDSEKAAQCLDIRLFIGPFVPLPFHGLRFEFRTTLAGRGES